MPLFARLATISAKSTSDHETEFLTNRPLGSRETKPSNVMAGSFGNLNPQSSAPPITGNVDLDGHAPNGGSIEAFNGGFGFRLGWHLHKTD